MSNEHFDDETLVAFADGELDDATSERLEAALETDEALAARLAVFLESRDVLASAMKPLIDEPVPDALRLSVERMVADAAVSAAAAPVAAGETVVPFRPKTAPQAPAAMRRALLPLAASIVAVVAGLAGYQLGRSGSATGTDPLGQVAAILDSEPSGAERVIDGAGTLRIISSFRAEAGALCREYELEGEAAVETTIACRDGNAWATRLAVSAPRAEGYAPASAQDTIDAWLSSINAGAPLGTDEERSALSAGR